MLQLDDFNGIGSPYGPSTYIHHFVDLQWPLLYTGKEQDIVSMPSELKIFLYKSELIGIWQTDCLDNLKILELAR